MIRGLGIGRLVFLATLILFNVALALLAYMYLTPQKIKLDRDLRVIRQETSVLRSDIGGLEVDLEQFDEQRAVFDKVKDRGFLSAQDRRYAENYFKEAQNRKNMVSVAANIKAGMIEEDEKAARAGYKVLNSPVIVVIQAVDDTVVHRFLHDMQYDFKGHVSVDDFHIRRVGDVTGPILRAIANRSTPKLVEAKIIMSWRTLIPESDVISQEQGGAR
jgi:hypothetical protein